MKEYAASTSETSAPANGGASPQESRPSYQETGTLIVEFPELEQSQRAPKEQSSTSHITEDKSSPTKISKSKMADTDKFLEDKSSKISSRKTRRHKGDGSGCIYWRTVTKKGKTYQEAYYQYELWSDGDRLIKSSKYIPKRLLALVQAKEAASSPVQEVLRVLGVGKPPGESSCPACEQPLPGLEDGCGVCGWISPESISPKKNAEEFFRGNSQASPPSISPKKEPSKFFRGNSQVSPPSISPKKKGRGENKIPASGSLVPVIQTRRSRPSHPP